MYESLAVVVLVPVVALFVAYQRNLRRASRAEPQLSEARRAGFALTNAIAASADVEAATRQAAQTALAACRAGAEDAPTDLEPMRGRLDAVAAAADSAAEHAAALARRIRLPHAEIMRAAESSPLELHC